ncbi:hypothetical protein F5880DRAFT_237986 [Lentinula raphanica]|nr:hypothetical protein F5880DRAFT_237986 [Lentinula raphanica]
MADLFSSHIRLVFLILFLSHLTMVSTMPVDLAPWKRSDLDEPGPEPNQVGVQRSQLDIIPYHVWLKLRHQDNTNALRPNSPIRDEDEVWYLYISLRHTFQAVKTGDSKWQLVKCTSPAQSGTLKLGEIAARAKEDAKEIFNKILGIEGDDQFQTLNNVIEFLRGNLKFGDRALPEHTRMIPEPGNPWEANYSAMRKVILKKEQEKAPETSVGGKRPPPPDFSEPPAKASKTGLTQLQEHPKPASDPPRSPKSSIVAENSRSGGEGASPEKGVDNLPPAKNSLTQPHGVPPAGASGALTPQVAAPKPLSPEEAERIRGAMRIGGATFTSQGNY